MLLRVGTDSELSWRTWRSKPWFIGRGEWSWRGFPLSFGKEIWRIKQMKLTRLFLWLTLKLKRRELQILTTLLAWKRKIVSIFDSDCIRSVVICVYWSSDTSARSVSIKGSEKLEATFKSLKLETEYKISIHCDYGGVVVQCGTATVYTALPIKLTEMNSQLYVYEGRSGGEGWYRQEENCKKGAGTLVSFGTRDEEELLRPALIASLTTKFKYFWIGLNMCRQKKGKRLKWTRQINGRHHFCL